MLKDKEAPEFFLGWGEKSLGRERFAKCLTSMYGRSSRWCFFKVAELEGVHKKTNLVGWSQQMSRGTKIKRFNWVHGKTNIVFRSLLFCTNRCLKFSNFNSWNTEQPWRSFPTCSFQVCKYPSLPKKHLSHKIKTTQNSISIDSHRFLPGPSKLS